MNASYQNLPAMKKLSSIHRRTFMSFGLGAVVYTLLPSRILNHFVSQHMTAPSKPIFKTDICRLFDIEYPIFQAGMGNVAGPELVAAVSNAGGLGILSATMLSPDAVRKSIQEVRQLTDKPFGINLLLQQDMFPPADFTMAQETVEAVQHTLNGFRTALNIPASNATPPKLPPLIAAAFEVILEEKVPVWSVGLGNPGKEMVERCHQKGIKVMAMLATLEDAITVSQSGVDAIVAQGSEAGGHRSTWEKKKSGEYASIGTLPLLQSIIEKVQVPVIAAGGISDGKCMLAALSLGAQGVMMGTRFVATKESIAPDSYKQKIVESSSDATTLTDVFTGMYARVLRNQFTEQYRISGTPVLPPGRQYVAASDIVKAAGEQQNNEYYPLYAGQGIDQIREILPAKTVVNQLVHEALTALQHLNTAIVHT
jgi:nitronate monooxygenase